jgi:hypothetical protein
MDAGLRQEKYTGSSQPTKAGSENVSAPVEYTGAKKASPVLKNAPTKDASLTSTGEVSASKILAVQVMMGDFKALKDELPTSRITSSNGKIYWCAELPGHTLAVENGKLLVDGKSASILLEKLLEGE